MTGYRVCQPPRPAFNKVGAMRDEMIGAGGGMDDGLSEAGRNGREGDDRMADVAIEGAVLPLRPERKVFGDGEDGTGPHRIGTRAHYDVEPIFGGAFR